MSAPARPGRRRTAVTYLLGLAVCLPLGTLWHEVVGHAGAAVLAGGHMTSLHVLGLDLYPRIAWVGWIGYFGYVNYEGVTSDAAHHWIGLAGSGSTWLVSLLATLVLWLRRWRGGWRVFWVCASLWWIDLVTYLLPVFGLRRVVFFGGAYSEPYECAVALGMNGTLFLVLMFGLSAALAAGLIRRLVADARS